MTNNTFQTFGKLFQEKLCYLILEDRVFADRMIEVLKIEFLESKHLQWFVDKVFNYKTTYKTHPSTETMETIIKSNVEKENELLQKQIVDFYVRWNKTNIEDKEFIKHESLDFCRKQKLHEGMMKCTGLLKTNSFDEIKQVIDTALKAGAEIDPGHDYIKDFEKRYVDNVRFPISTGWEKIDEITSGGLGRGEYGLIMGASGGGKSMLMVHLAVEALKKGLNVIYYTLELRPEVIGQRFDACLTGIPISELKEHKQEVLDKIKNIPGKLIIKFYPKKSASITTIRNHFSRLKTQGFKGDMVILDYLDLLKSVGIKKELRHEIGETYDEFEAFGQEENLVLWTGSQINRTGFGSNTISMEHVSEAFNKNFGSYLTIGLSRDDNDKVNNTGRITICKNRSGPDGITFNVFMDPANVDIKVLDVYDSYADQHSMIDQEEEKRRRQERFKKYKNKNGGNV